MRRPLFMLAGTLLAMTSAAASGEPLSREQVLENAARFAGLAWTLRDPTCPESCPCPPGWKSAFEPGRHVGIPYKWGGWDDETSFLENIGLGLGAGSSRRDGVSACTTGQDCSGFVSRVWETGQKYGTRTIHEISRPIPFDELRPGDALNKKGTHIVLYAGRREDGIPIFYEASGSAAKVRLNASASWAYLNGYRAVRYRHVSEDAVVCVGTTDDPIVISTFPFHDRRTMFLACSDVFDRYACKPSADESGREFVYRFEVDRESSLEAQVTDPEHVDVDLHLLRALDVDACVARADRVLRVDLDSPGTYYLVADTFTDRAQVERAGPFTLDVRLAAIAGRDRPPDPRPAAEARAEVDGGDDDGCGCSSTHAPGNRLRAPGPVTPSGPLVPPDRSSLSGPPSLFGALALVLLLGSRRRR